MPLYRKGHQTVKAPLYFSDLATGIMNALEDPSTKGRVFEAYG